MSRQTPPAFDPVAQVRATLEASVRAKQAVAQQLAEPIARAGEWVAAAYRAGGKTLLFGNGGSAADAQHIAAEWTGKLGPDRTALPSLALSANTSSLTAIGNDYGFERVFARLIEAHGRAGDVAIAISTSGNSPNVIEAVEEAKRRRMRAPAPRSLRQARLHARMATAQFRRAPSTRRARGWPRRPR